MWLGAGLILTLVVAIGVKGFNFLQCPCFMSCLLSLSFHKISFLNRVSLADVSAVTCRYAVAYGWVVGVKGHDSIVHD